VRAGREDDAVKESRYNVWVERDGAAYVYNGVSGALRRLSRADCDAVRRFLANDRDTDSDCRPELLADLIRGRMLVRDGFDELSFLTARYRTSRHGTDHFALTIVTSLGCNFDCPYCFEAKHPSIMNAEVQEAVLRLLDDKLPTIRGFSVTWYGGEPLVGKRSLLALSDAFIGRCDRHEVHYGADIITNGSLLDEETCVQLRDRRVGMAQVTLDGPPDVHDRMRPTVGGRGTFWGIVRNLHHAVEYLSVAVRVNVDRGNIGRAEELLQILAVEGFAGKLSVYPGQLVAVADGAPAPSASYGGHCFTGPEFARAQLAFAELARRYGFGSTSLPRPTGTPCTAVRANELVVGSKGELYKCFESVGNRLEVIGDIRRYRETNGRLEKWLKYDPFADAECRGCIALPVCMGGCAHHAMDPKLYDNRCDTFRHTYREQVLGFVETAEQAGADGPTASAPAGPRMEKAR
jgi:uncharacterized protein